MKIFFKNMIINKFTTRIIFEHGNSLFDEKIVNEMEAVSVLLGAYQKYGRKMGMNKYSELKKKFDYLLREVNKEIH